MKVKDFYDAIEILTKHHSNEIVINKVEPHGQVSPVLESPTIHIKNCVPSVVNKLVKAGFMVSMTNGLLSVDKI
jgi:hypothetical protein